METSDKNMYWNLDALYKGFDNDFLNDINKYKHLIEDLKDFSKNCLENCKDRKNALETFIQKLIELESLDKLSIYPFLILSVDTENTEALKYSDILDDISTELSGPFTVFKEFIKNIDNLDEIISSSLLLKEHEFYLKEIKAEANYMLSEKEEILLSKLSTTGSSSWEKLREQLTGTLTADLEVDGKIVPTPITVIRNMAHDPSLAVRKKAYEAELEAYKKIDKSVSFCLNAIKGEAITVAEIRGYESVLDMTLKNSRMEKETLDTMLSVIRENLSVFQKYFKKKADLLDDKNGLKYYNLYAPVGASTLKFSYEEAQKFIIDNFSKFSKDLGDFAKSAFENNWIDAKTREGKTGGAYCCGIHSIKQSRIMSNFTETAFESVVTLAHELGHGYHSDLLKDQSPLNAAYPMPIAETASTFCEALVCFEALKTAKKEDKLAILEHFISEATACIVDIYGRFEFESALIENRKNGSLSVSELNELMKSSAEKAYGGGIDKTTVHPYMWLNKGHYYSADNNFYNFPYAYGQMFALGLYKMYLDEGSSFVEKFKTLFKATGKSSLKDVGLLCGIDVNDKSFWEGSMKIIEKNIDDFVNL